MRRRSSTSTTGATTSLTTPSRTSRRRRASRSATTTSTATRLLHAKLVAGMSGYDIVVPGSHFAKMQIQAGLLQKLDKSKIPNLANLDPAIQAQLAKIDPGNEHLVDWLWGYTTVGINVDKVRKAALGAMPHAGQRLGPRLQARVHGEAEGLRRLLPRHPATEILPTALQVPRQGPPQQECRRLQGRRRDAESRAALRDAFSGSGSDYINQMAKGQLCAVIGWSGDIKIAKRQVARRPRTAESRGGTAQDGRPAFLRHDGDSQGCQAPARTPTSGSTTSCGPRCTPALTNKVFYANPNKAAMKFVDPAAGQGPGRVPSPEAALPTMIAHGHARPGHAQDSSDAHLHEFSRRQSLTRGFR